MGVSVAEYYGQRTDVDSPNIEPIVIPQRVNRKLVWENGCPTCPFTSGNVCKKLKSGKEPICCVRKADGTLWINCSERLCSTKKDLPLCNHQSDMLLQISRHIFSPNVSAKDVCVKREVRLKVIESKKNEKSKKEKDDTKYNADYIITTKNGFSDFSGPDRLILEMQGGGETTNTGELTRHVKSWAKNIATNDILRLETKASTLETNAWRRQQEQFIVKGNIAMKTWKGCGMAFCMGTLLFDYLMNKLKSANLPDLREYNWTLALIGIKEDVSQPKRPGPIPLIVDEERLLYTNYQSFVQALINQGLPTPEAFCGDFYDLSNEKVRIKNFNK